MTKKKKPRRRPQGQRAGPGSGPRSTPARRPAPAPPEDDGALAQSEPVSEDHPGVVGLSPDGEGAEPEATSADVATETRPARSGTPRKAAPAGTRRTRDAREPPPRGLFAGLRAPSPFPRFAETLGSAVGAVARTPVLVVGPLVAVLVWWLLLLAVGLDHVPAGFMVVLAIPPISSFFDLNLVLGTFRGLGGGAIALLFGLIALRAIIWAAVIGSIVEVFDRGRASSVGLAWAVRALPATLAYLVANVAAILVAQVLASALGSLGSLIFMLAFVGALYFLVFTPVAAIRSPVPFREALRRSVAVARFPGSRHVGLVFLYFFISFFPLLYALQAPGPFAANPTISQWAIFLGLTLVHVVFIASFAYRYIAVEDEIPEPAPRPARGAPASRRRR